MRSRVTCQEQTQRVFAAEQNGETLLKRLVQLRALTRTRLLDALWRC